MSLSFLMWAGDLSQDKFRVNYLISIFSNMTTWSHNLCRCYRGRQCWDWDSVWTFLQIGRVRFSLFFAFQMSTFVRQTSNRVIEPFQNDISSSLIWSFRSYDQISSLIFIRICLHRSLGSFLFGFLEPRQNLDHQIFLSIFIRPHPHRRLRPRV